MTRSKQRGARRPEPRRSRVPIVLASLLVAVLFAGIGLGWYVLRGANQRPVATGPNVVVVVLDDLDLWTWQHLPELAGQLSGRSYSNAFVTNSARSASLVSMLTGQYAHNHGVLSDEEPIGGFGRSVRNRVQHRTVQTALHDAGYRTGYVGAYLPGYGDASVHEAAGVPAAYVPPDWDRWYVSVAGPASAGPAVNADGAILHPINPGVGDFADQAVAFMTDTRSPASYLLWVGLSVPSGSVDTPPDEPPTEKLPPVEEDVSDKPDFLQALVPPDPASVAELQRQRLESLVPVQALLTRLVAAMDADTYLILTSATGFRLGQNGLPTGTGTAYEPDIRVPLVIVGPGVAAGTDERLALNLDIAPTVAGITGVSLPDAADGVSLLTGDPVSRDAFAVEHEATTDIPYYNAVRTLADQLYVLWQSGATELYHLADDPVEDHNLTADERAGIVYGEELATLGDRLQALLGCAGETCQ